MPIYKCEICGKVHRTGDDVCCRTDQPAEPRPGGVSANGGGSLSCASQAKTGNEVNRHFPPVLDACCGRRMFWFDKHDKRAVYVDNRRESYLHKQKARRDHWIVIDPDEVADFTNLPFPDNTFACVIFDPPHLVTDNITASMHKYYGILSGDWREMLRKGFAECFRVLKPEGTLVFKWSEYSVPLREILALTPEKPLVGNRKAATSKTHWVLFLKPNAELSGKESRREDG